MIVKTEAIACDVCEKPIDTTTQEFDVYADGKVHIHKGCRRKLFQWVLDEPDKYITAVQANHDKHGLTIQHLVEGTDEHMALIRDTRCYLFIDNCDLGPYVCVCSDVFNAVPPIIRGLDNTRETILAAFVRGKFWEIKTDITVSMVDEDGHGLRMGEPR